MTSTTGTARRHPGLWWLAAVLLGTVVFPGVGAAVAFLAAWQLPRRRVALIILGVVLILWTVFFTPWGVTVQGGSSVHH